VAFSDLNLRVVTGNLENISSHLSRNVHTADELKVAFDAATDKAKWIDDIGFNVLRKTDGKVEFINPNGRTIKWTEQNPNNFPNQISSAINSGDAGRIAEGEVAQAVFKPKAIRGIWVRAEIRRAGSCRA
jgi:hypothetical protein